MTKTQQGSLHLHVCKLEFSAKAALCPLSPVKEAGGAGGPSSLLAWGADPTLPTTWSAAALCMFMPALM